MKKILTAFLFSIIANASFAQDPTIQASNIQFTAYGTTTLSFSWTRGNGDYCLVVVHPYSTNTSFPIDGVTYTASSTYGNGSHLGNSNYVVYKSTGSAMTVYGLTSNVRYSILIYEYNVTFGYEYYKTPGAGNNRYTLATSPTTQATALTASSITSAGATLSWTSGNGTNELVSLRQSTSNTNLPADGNAYTENSIFGSGSALGSSFPYSYVVYSNSSTSVGVSGCSAATNYVANCVTYNGTGVGAPGVGAQNYYTTGSPTVGFTTYAAQPTAASTAVYFTDISDTALTINWVKPSSGGGSYSLVTLRESTSNSNLPADATAYTASTVFGSGTALGSSAPYSYVVYNGTGNTVRVTGLVKNTSYAASVCEFNGGAGTYNRTENYMTSSSTYYNYTLDKQPLTISSGLTLTPSANSITASWTNGDGARRLVAVKPARVKTALAFDGTDDYVNIPYNAAQQPTSAVTLEAWAYKSNWTSGGTGVIAGNYYGSSGYLIFVNSSYAFAYVRNGSSIGDANTSISYLTPGWHHFALTYDGRYTTLFIDGAKKDVDDAGGTYPITYSYSNNFTIGAQSGTSTTPVGNYFNGFIDEVRVWNTARTVTQLRTNMNQSMPGNETNLVAEWKMDDGFTSGTTVKDNAIYADANYHLLQDGVMTNMTTTAASSFTGTSGWILSGATVDGPKDNTSYSGNSSFMSGTSINTGYHAVYSSTGNSVTVTNLTPGTYYNFSVYDYNLTSYYNYLSSTYLTADVQTTAAPLPTITSYTPALGSVGTVVTINGTNFDAIATNNKVYFGTEQATVVSATTTQLQAVVPYCANNVPISVTVNSLSAYSKKPFVVTSSCAATIGTSSLSNSSVQTGTAKYGVVAGDINLDGKSDLLSVDYSGGYFTVTKNLSANGSLSWGTNTNFTTPSPANIALGDFDGDQKLDPVTLNYAGNTINVFRNTSTSSTFSFAASADCPTQTGPWSVAVSDIDKDGKPDIVIGYPSYAGFSVFRNTSSIGYISFAARVDISGSASAYSMATADIDGDGKEDVVTGGGSSSTYFYKFTNTSTVGNISFAAPTSVFTVAGGGVISLAIADMNNNGTIDVAAGLSNNTVRVYSNTSGSFTWQSPALTTLSNNPYGLAVYDIDGDGGLNDIVVGYSTSGTVSIFEQTSAFVFGTRADIAPSSGTYSQWLALDDFSMDGKTDIAAGTVSSFVNIFNNDMNPLSSEPTTASSGITFTNTLQTAMTFTFTAGNGTERIIIARKGSAVNISPFDGATYTPNSVFGLGTDLGSGQYVVYKSNGNSVTVTGLESYSTYYFSIYEYNGATCSANYLTTSSASNSNTTLNTPPTLGSISNPSAICQNSGQQSIGLTGIGTGAGNETQTLSVTASSNNTTLIPNGNISFSYTSPDATGTIFYTPANGQSGTAAITVTVNDNAGNNNTIAKSFTVSVTEDPSVSVAGSDQDICTPSTSLAGNNPSSGTGTWSFVYTSNGSITINSPNAYNSSIDNFTTGDSVRLAWTISNSPCVSSVDSVSIKKVVCPLNAEFSASQTSFCGSSANVTFTDLSTAASTTVTAWAWTFTGGSPPSSSSQTPVTIAYTNPGVYSVILQITDNTSTTNTETKIDYITVTALPGNPGAISGNTTVCQGSQSQSYSVAPISGATTYTWTVPSGASIISGQGNNNIVVDYGTSAATGNITVMGQNVCGNGGTGFQLVTVNPLPGTSSTISGPASVCQGQNGVVFSTASLSNASTYTWTVPAGASFVGPNSGSTVTLNFSSSASSGNIDVMGVNSCGTGASSGGMTLTVNPLPDAAGTISGTAAVCEKDTVSFNIASLGNTNSYTWSVPSGASIVSGSGTNAIMVAFPVGASSGNVSVSGVNSCGNGISSSLAVTVNPLPVSATAIFGNATVCAGDNSEAYFVSAIMNAANYIWTLPSGFSITAGGNTNGILASLSPTAQSGVISVYGNNSCGDGAPSTFSVTVSPLPDSAGTITGADSVCQGQTAVAYSVQTIANAAGYNWTIPTGATISSGSNTNSITVDFSATTNSGFVTVIGTNSCGNGFSADSFAVVVNPLPDAAGIISGSDTVCQGDTVSYYINSVTNASSYTWSVPNGAGIISGNNSDSITVAFSAAASSGNIGVSGTNSCGNGISSEMSITVNPLPDNATAILGNTTVCAGAANESYFVSAINDAVNYVWMVPSGFSISSGANTNSILVNVSSTASSGTISVYGNNGCGDGVASSINITVTPLPDSSGIITGSDTVCQGQNGVMYSVPSIANAAGYNWTISTGGSIASGNNTNSITVDFSTSAVSGFVTVTGTNSCGNGLSTDSFAVTVNPLPAAAGTISGDSAISICPLQTGVVYTISPVTNSTGYTWSVPSGATIISGNNTYSITVDYTITSQSGNITVTPTNACGNGASSSMMINVDTLLTVPVCMVTVDSINALNNIIAWEKLVVTNIDSFIVYRDTANNNYARIGAVPYDSLSIFIDTVRTLYAANGDPQWTSWRYKLAVMDTCGDIGPMSPYHHTIFFQHYGNGNFGWSEYQIEGQALPIPPLSQYKVERDDNSGGTNFQTIATLSASSTLYTDPNYALYPNGIWRVKTLWSISCTPSIKNPQVMGSGGNSHSNWLKTIDTTVSVHSFTDEIAVSVYPNPNRGAFTVSAIGNNEISEINLRNMIGEEVYKTDKMFQQSSIYLPGIAKGIYHLEIKTPNNIFNKKIIIQ